MQITLPATQNIWSCIEEVSRFQERSTTFISLYERFIIRSQEQNQFLGEDDHNSNQGNIEQQQPYRYQWQNDAHLEGKSEYCVESRRVAQESIEFEPRMMNLSKIFEDISLGEEGRAESGSIGIQLHIQSSKTVMALERCNNGYNLSNFSSFNNQKAAESATSFDIKDLLLKVQQKAGRQLNKKGIASIVSQLERAVEVESKDKMQYSEITQYSLKASCIQPVFGTHNAFDFDLQTRRLKERTDLTNIPEHQDLFQKREIDREPTVCAPDHNQKQNKRSSQLNFRKKAPHPVQTKEIRIIRKNCPKSSLVMAYTDPKQLENFCISNKIYGRDKQKIAKAIRQCKNIVSLD